MAMIHLGFVAPISKFPVLKYLAKLIQNSEVPHGILSIFDHHGPQFELENMIEGVIVCACLLQDKGGRNL
jgi:hypothetical protein